MIYFEEDDTRHEVELPNLVITVIEKLVDFKNALYRENSVNSSAGLETVFTEDKELEECLVTIFATGVHQYLF